jgi:hypothetical protein
MIVQNTYIEVGELGAGTMKMSIIIVEPRCFYVKLNNP